MINKSYKSKSYILLYMILVILMMFVSCKNDDKDKPSSKDMFGAIDKGDYNKLKSLLDDGGDVNATNDKGQTLLIYSIANADKIEASRSRIKVSQNNISQVNTPQVRMLKSTTGTSYTKSTNIVRLLISKKADVNKKDKEGNTAVLVAAEKNSEIIVGILVLNKADTSVKNSDGKTAIDIAKEKGNTTMEQYISNPKSIPANIDDLPKDDHDSAWDKPLTASDCKAYGDLSTIDKFTDTFFGTEDSRGNPIIQSDQSLKMIRCAVEVSHLNVNAKDTNGDTILIFAVLGDDDLITSDTLIRVKYLVFKGANVNIFGDQSALMWAASLYEDVDNGALELVKYLVEHGANVNAQNSSGFTALISATEAGYIEIVQYLMSKNADSTLVAQYDSDAGVVNQTACDIANELTHEDTGIAYSDAEKKVFLDALHNCR